MLRNDHFADLFLKMHRRVLLASVSVHDNLSSGQSRISVRSSDNKFTGRIDV